MQLLLKYNADPNASGEGCGTALQIATLKGNGSICNQLLKAIADANPDCKANFDVSDGMRVYTCMRIWFKLLADCLI